MIDGHEVGRRIKHIRSQLNLTQAELGQKLGVKKLAVAKYEAGRVPKLEMLNKLARIGGVPTSWFFQLEPKILLPSAVDVPASLKKAVNELLEQLRTSKSLKSAALQRRFEARCKELLIRCRCDLEAYRQALQFAQRRLRAPRGSH